MDLCPQIFSFLFSFVFLKVLMRLSYVSMIFLSCILRSEDLRKVLIEEYFPFLNSTVRGRGKRIQFFFL